MKFVQIFIYFLAIISLSFAEILDSDIQVNIFDSIPREYERNVIESMKILKNFIENDDISVEVTRGSVGLSFLSFNVAKFSKFIPMIRHILADRSDWRDAFTRAIADEQMHAVTENQVNWLEATLQTLQSKIKSLGDESLSYDSRRNIASHMHTELDRIINFIDLESSLFRKYPLLGAPLVIQLAPLVAFFSPIAKALIRSEAMNPEISCKMHDILVDYLARTINARLHQLHSDVSIFRSIVTVMLLPYREDGYGIPIDCAIGCQPRKSICLKDKFSTLEFFSAEPKCTIDYAALLRHRIEDLFPIDLLKNQCTEPQTPTGKTHRNFDYFFYRVNDFLQKFYSTCFVRFWMVYNKYSICIHLPPCQWEIL